MAHVLKAPNSLECFGKTLFKGPVVVAGGSCDQVVHNKACDQVVHNSLTV